MTAVCDGLNPDINAPEDKIEYQFKLTIIRDSTVSDYYNYSSAGYGGDLERVDKG